MCRYVLLISADGALMPMVCFVARPNLTIAMSYFSRFATVVTGRVAGVVISVCRLVCYCITVCTFMPMICLIARPFFLLAVRGTSA